MAMLSCQSEELKSAVFILRFSYNYSFRYSASLPFPAIYMKCSPDVIYDTYSNFCRPGMPVSYRSIEAGKKIVNKRGFVRLQ